MTSPLISCLCLSYKRPQQLARAIECFRGQTYENKELIIVGHSDDAESLHVAREAGPDVKFHAVPKAILGELRNTSVALSGGEYFCQWDDDDWYHKNRLSEQLKAIRKSKKQACVMAYWLMYDQLTGAGYLSLPSMWAGTLMCSRSVYAEGVLYQNLGKNEDSEYLMELYAKNCLVPLIMPSLYIYVYHGSNTWEQDHFRTIFSHSQRLPASISKLIGKIVSQEYSHAYASKAIMHQEVVREFNYFQAWLNEAGG